MEFLRRLEKSVRQDAGCMNVTVVEPVLDEPHQGGRFGRVAAPYGPLSFNVLRVEGAHPRGIRVQISGEESNRIVTLFDSNVTTMHVDGSLVPHTTTGRR